MYSFLVVFSIFFSTLGFLLEGSKLEATADVVAGMLSSEDVDAFWPMISNSRITLRAN
jgi:hypothetical protein